MGENVFRHRAAIDKADWLADCLGRELKTATKPRVGSWEIILVLRGNLMSNNNG